MHDSGLDAALVEGAWQVGGGEQLICARLLPMLPSQAFLAVPVAHSDSPWPWRRVGSQHTSVALLTPLAVYTGACLKSFAPDGLGHSTGWALPKTAGTFPNTDCLQLGWARPEGT